MTCFILIQISELRIIKLNCIKEKVDFKELIFEIKIKSFNLLDILTCYYLINNYKNQEFFKNN